MGVGVVYREYDLKITLTSDQNHNFNYVIINGEIWIATFKYELFSKKDYKRFLFENNLFLSFSVFPRYDQWLWLLFLYVLE